MDLSRTENHPVVTVIIPTYNRENLIARSIQSVLCQSYEDFEVIVVDDGSKDRTKELVKSLSDPRIKYIRLEENRGAGTARNIGIKRTRGKFIAFQDSDDEWLPEKLEKQMVIFEKNTLGIGVVYSDMERVLKDKTIKYHGSPKIASGRLIDPATQFYQVCMLGIQSSIIRRECFDRVGYFNENIPSLEDLELFIRLSRHFDFYHIQEPLVRYYENEGLSKNMRAQYHARKLLLKLYFHELIEENKNFLVKEFISVHLGTYYETIKRRR
jgi:glycosyltransferase involved in cell wall biosynthesis